MASRGLMWRCALTRAVGATTRPCGWTNPIHSWCARIAGSSFFAISVATFTRFIEEERNSLREPMGEFRCAAGKQHFQRRNRQGDTHGSVVTRTHSRDEVNCSKQPGDTPGGYGCDSFRWNSLVVSRVGREPRPHKRITGRGTTSPLALSREPGDPARGCRRCGGVDGRWSRLRSSSARSSDAARTRESEAASALHYCRARKASSRRVARRSNRNERGTSSRRTTSRSATDPCR